MHSKYWMPLVWAGAMLKKARKENRICNDAMLLAMVNEINRIRSVSGDLLNYDWVNIPLVYTQVTQYKIWTNFLNTFVPIVHLGRYIGCLLLHRNYDFRRSIFRPSKRLSRYTVFEDNSKSLIL